MTALPRDAARLALRALVVILVANTLFFAGLIVASVRPDGVRSRVREAFASGELGDRDYLGFDLRHGMHQYSDCNVLQMLSNPGSSHLERAIAPTVYAADTSLVGQCAVLHALVTNLSSRDTMRVTNKYSRYWHGVNLPAGWGLRFLTLGELRRAIAIAVWLSIACLALGASLRGGMTRVVGLTIAIAASTVWATPFFATTIVHGVADAAMLLLLAALVFAGRQMDDDVAMTRFGALAGSIIAFFEAMLGNLPIAVAWIAVLILAGARDRRDSDHVTARLVKVGLASFVGGAALTAALKVMLAWMLAQVRAPQDFASQLAHHMRWPTSRVLPGTSLVLPGVIAAPLRMVRMTPVLTYGSARAAILLLTATALCWAGAAILGWRRRHESRGRDALLVLLASATPLAWSLLVPSHVIEHAALVVRMMVVPISLAPVALVWSLRRER